ncbi:hypothetical protein ACFLX3_01890 [Chloroflexota bacterium]
MMINNPLEKQRKPNRTPKFSHCPQCGQKGLYHVPRQYSRCRYCSLFRIALPGQDF